MSVLVFRGGKARLYPLDGWEVTTNELTDILEAIQIGFDAALEHDPIDPVEK